jgi:hypothetical protein
MSRTHMAQLAQAITASRQRTALLQHWQDCEPCDGAGLVAKDGQLVLCQVCEGHGGWIQTSQAALATVKPQDGTGLVPPAPRCQSCGHRFGEADHAHYLAWLQLTVCCTCCTGRHHVPCTWQLQGITDPARPDAERERMLDDLVSDLERWQHDPDEEEDSIPF